MIAYHTPFDSPPTEPGEYMALMDRPQNNEAVPNRRYWDGRYWSAPYFEHNSPESKANARARLTDFHLYWASVP